MKVTTVAPSPALAPFVRTFTFVETDAAATRTLLPDTGLVLGFRYGGRAVQLDDGAEHVVPDVPLTGLRFRARTMFTSAGGGIVLAAFTEGGAARFFAEPLHELFGATIALDEIVPRSAVERVASRIAEARTHAERVAAFEAFLLERMKQPVDALVVEAVKAIRAARGAIRVAELAAGLGIGQDRLEKRFRRVVGASPKQLASILRVRHAVDSYRPGMSFTALSLEAGYFDQSHFIREFRAVTGATPRRFFSAGEHC